MSSPYIGEIRCFGGNFAPVGWWFCDGSLLAIAENDTLFNLIGTTYGGDGQTTFALPDLRGRVPIHQGAGFVLAQNGGTETVTLTAGQIPSHAHTLNTTRVPPGGAPMHLAAPSPTAYISNSNPDAVYKSAPATINAPFASNAIGPTGGDLPHNNMQPYLAVSFIISLFGIFPSQT
jgi:microcystin-dependent protein